MQSRFIIESFWQQKDNCACVAMIKCVLLMYGIYGGFRTRKKGKYTVVTLRDGQSWSFSSRDMDRLNKGNNMGFRRYPPGEKRKKVDKIRKFARLCFAVLVSNMQVRGYRGREYSRKQAIRALTKEGIDTSWFHMLLGLQRTSSRKITKKNIHRCRSLKAALLFNRKHIVALSNGWYDDFGVARKLEEIPVLLGEKANAWYTIR
jgi:hypothetical protein